MELSGLPPHFDERNPVDQRLSLSFCESRFGMYGRFCTLPLWTSALESGVHDTKDSLEVSLSISAKDESYMDALQDWFRGLGFDDPEFFTVKDYLLLIQLDGPCSPLSNEQLDLDEEELLHEQRTGERMFKSHAAILLKALKYWRVRYDEKYEEWAAKYQAVLNAKRMATLLEGGYISPHEAAVGRILEDEGYSSE
jgi:hypothetical protein